MRFIHVIRGLQMRVLLSSFCLAIVSCQFDDASVVSATPQNEQFTDDDRAISLTSDGCVDPDVSMIASGETFTRCDGTLGVGTFDAEAGDIRSGVTIFGVTGTYTGSATAPDPWDIRYGVVVGETTGKLKVNCRNRAETSIWDYNTDGLTTFDTIDDYANGAATLPSEDPWGSDAYHCGFNDPIDPNWERVVTTPATMGYSSVFLDEITGLKWARGMVTSDKDWDEA